MRGMEVSPKTLREVEFREKMRGYHPEDVDQFLEQVAAGIEVVQDRLRQAVERAQRAEAAASESGGNDEALRRTLVLAQRTADLAVQEAREQAARILAGAEHQAQAILAEAEERGRRALEDSIAEAKAELARLEALRAGSQQDVDNLCRWLDEHRAYLRAALEEAAAAVDRTGVLWPAPSTRPIDVPGALPVPVAAAAQSSGTALDPEAPLDDGPDTKLWSPDDEDLDLTAVAVDEEVVSARSNLDLEGPDDRAMDDFFEDNEEMAGERRFGGRLRRRR
jgi:DivIVA domain-containing protein